MCPSPGMPNYEYLDYSGIGTFLRGKKISQNEELAGATKFSFVLEREGIKQTQTTAAAAAAD